MIRNKSVYLLIFVLSISLLLLASCAKDSVLEKLEFNDEKLGFSIEIPEDWNDKYVIEGYDGGINVFSKTNRDFGGLLFSIERLVGELITEEDMQQAPVSQKILLQGNGYTYILRLPSDVQYPLDKKKLSDEYQEMFNQVENVASSITLLGEVEPVAKNEGFKVVGSSFFNVEIPVEWEIKASEGHPLRWDLYKGEDVLGDIGMVPYKTYTFGETDYLQETLVDDELQRNARIYVVNDEKMEDILEKIKSSFVFTNGPYNVLDLKTAAGEYIFGGGRSIFGQIESFDLESGEPVAVNIKVMELILNGPDDAYDAGYHIEDLNIIEKYSLDFGVLIAPLKAPDYAYNGIYDMNLVDNDFIESYEHINEFYYEFFIGSDGQLKIIFGQYFP